MTVAIILILAAWYFPRIAARHSEPGEGRTPRERAYGTGCSEYEGQMNQAAFMYKNDNDDQPPRNLNDLKRYGVTDDMIHAEGCYFVMDPRSGYVRDVGHGRYVPGTKKRGPHHRYPNATGFHPDSPEAANQQSPPQVIPQPEATHPPPNYGGYSEPPPNYGPQGSTPAPIDSPGDDSTQPAAEPPPGNQPPRHPGDINIPGSGVSVPMPTAGY